MFLVISTLALAIILISRIAIVLGWTRPYVRLRIFYLDEVLILSNHFLVFVNDFLSVIFFNIYSYNLMRFWYRVITFILCFLVMKFWFEQSPSAGDGFLVSKIWLPDGALTRAITSYSRWWISYQQWVFLVTSALRPCSFLISFWLAPYCALCLASGRSLLLSDLAVSWLASD